MQQGRQDSKPKIDEGSKIKKQSSKNDKVLNTIQMKQIEIK